MVGTKNRHLSRAGKVQEASRGDYTGMKWSRNSLLDWGCGGKGSPWRRSNIHKLCRLDRDRLQAGDWPWGSVRWGGLHEVCAGQDILKRQTS